MSEELAIQLEMLQGIVKGLFQAGGIDIAPPTYEYDPFIVGFLIEWNSRRYIIEIVDLDWAES